MEEVGSAPAVDEFALFVEFLAFGRSESCASGVVAGDGAHDLRVGAHGVLAHACAEIAEHGVDAFQFDTAFQLRCGPGVLWWGGHGGLRLLDGRGCGADHGHAGCDRTGDRSWGRRWCRTRIRGRRILCRRWIGRGGRGDRRGGGWCREGLGFRSGGGGRRWCRAFGLDPECEKTGGEEGCENGGLAQVHGGRALAWTGSER
jgi:hypothetical protein